MTNEEKAREIANLCEACIENGHPCYGCSECESRGMYYGVLDMAEWKDQQLREIKDAFIAFCHNIINGMYVSIETAAKEQLEFLND